MCLFFWVIILKYVKFLREITKEDVHMVGGKAANLGEMIQKTNVPVPSGFVITAMGYWAFIKYNHLDEIIKEKISQIKSADDLEGIKKAGKEIREAILNGEFPEDLKKEIIEAYNNLAEKVGTIPFVAVRSSATAEDLEGASFAGQQETYLNVRGIDDLLEKTKKCIASLFTDRAIYYRIKKEFDHLKVALCVVVQLMVRSKVSGVMFTLDVRNGNRDVVMIEGSYGLGEYIVQGVVTPDTYVVNKKTLKIIEKHIADKDKMLIRLNSGGVRELKVPEDLRRKQALPDDKIIELAKYGIAIEDHYGRPMDIEWALDESGQLFIVQARPETYWSVKENQTEKTERAQSEEVGEVLTKGLPASPGIGCGKVRIIHSADEINKVQKGEVLVTEMTNPDMVPAMQRASAIVTQEGGMTSHAAIVSRELGIPCVVGVQDIFEVVKDGMEITVNGYTGEIIKGLVKKEKKEKFSSESEEVVNVISEIITATNVMMNLGVPEKAEEYAKLPCDGIGLMRMEFILASKIKIHPLKAIKEGKEQEYVDKLAENIEKVVRAFYPRPVILRFSDFKSNEYKDLPGGEEFEPKENNPMIGFRGCYRYIHPMFRKAFELEIEAVKKVREKGLKNLWVMVPFVRRIGDIQKVRKILKEKGLLDDPTMKLFIMAEVPSVALQIDEFCKYCDGFSIGSNDLTQLTLGVDRDSDLLAEEFDERDPAVLKAIEMIVKGAKRNGKYVSICGQAPSNYPEIVEYLVKLGIDSISVNPDKVIETRKLVAKIEKKIILENIRNI